MKNISEVFHVETIKKPLEDFNRVQSREEKNKR